MTSPAEELLYNLLPAIYRSRDVAQGEPLRALLGIVEREFQAIHGDIDGLYENLFIETCQEWVVPYIGELLGVRELGDREDTFLSRRAEVANAISYRRRKGTPAVLGQVVQDVTGWPARRVEYFDLLATTQQLNHLRPGKGGTVNLREAESLERLNTAFDSLPRTADLRLPGGAVADSSWRTRPVPGQHNVPNVGLFLWRLQSYPVDNGVAREVQPGCYTFHPLGVDTHLFNQPSGQRLITDVAQEQRVPLALRRRQLQEELEALRRGLVQGEPYHPVYFAEPPVIGIVIDGVAAGPDTIDVLDLSQWQRPPDVKEYGSPVDGGLASPERTELPIHVAIDPVLGRLTFPEGVTPEQVGVSYSYGFSADIGGGPYQRSETLTGPDADPWRALVNQNAPAAEAQVPASLPDEEVPVRWYSTVQQAVDAWTASGRDGVIQIVDNGTYHLGDTPLEISLGDRRRLVIEAADGRYPCLVGSISVAGEGRGASLSLNGMLIDGGMGLAGDLELKIAHCTLKPQLSVARAGMDEVGASIHACGSGRPNLRVEIAHSIVGPLRLPPTIAGLRVTDSIVDGGAGHAIAAESLEGSDVDFGPPVTLERATVFGGVSAHLVQVAQDVIFTGPVRVQRQQQGYMRYCYVPEGSVTPQRYNCQPDSALRDARDPDERSQVLYRIRPSFTAVVYGHPAYAQLSQGCPPEISAGAEDGSEMGVFHHLRQPQRMARLRAALDRYLRHGLEAGLFYAS